MTYQNYIPPVKISDLCRMTLEGTAGHIQLRNTLSAMDTERLFSLVKLLADGLMCINTNKSYELRKVQNQVIEIIEARRSDEALARLLGGVA